MQPLNSQDDFDFPLSLCLCGLSPFQLYLMNKKIIKSKKTAGRRTPRKAPPAGRTYTPPTPSIQNWIRRRQQHRLKSEPIYFFSVQSSSIHRKIFLASLLLHLDAEKKPPALLPQRLKNDFLSPRGGEGWAAAEGRRGRFKPLPHKGWEVLEGKNAFANFFIQQHNNTTTQHKHNIYKYIYPYIYLYCLPSPPLWL